MKGKVITMMKKWWMIAAVLALALSLTSCSRRGTGQFSNYGINFCDYSGLEGQGGITMGSFDVYTIASTTQAGMFQVVVIPISLTLPGDVATITVIDQATMLYKTLLPEVALTANQEISAGFLTQAELNKYDLISITSYVPGVDFLQANPEKDTICGLPLVGDGVNGLN